MNDVFHFISRKATNAISKQAMLLATLLLKNTTTQSEREQCLKELGK